MNNVQSKCKLSTISAVGILTLSLGASLASATDMGGMGPQPAALKYTDPSTTTYGIPYRWHVEMSDQSWTEFEYYVGAKSWWEPANPEATPGWTHSSNWVELVLKDDAYVEIKVKADDSGVPCTATGALLKACDQTTLVAVGGLYPAISLYSGVDMDTLSPQEHSFNPVGDDSFFTPYGVKYLASKMTKGKNSVKYKTKLAAGSYTLNIGGASHFFCNSTDDCYKGGRGYEASITTKPVHGQP